MFQHLPANQTNFVCDGMQYRFNPDTGMLQNNYGTIVACVKYDQIEHYHFYHWDTGTLMYSTHENNIDEYRNSLAYTLVQQYSVFE